MIEINEQLAIPERELLFSASRSAGPGGQHVNKASTRLTLRFDVKGSPSLNSTQRALILSRLAGRISKDGLLQFHSQQFRSQAANRRELLERFAANLREALIEPIARKKSRPSRSAREERLRSKRKQSRLKQERSHEPNDDEG